MGSDAGAIQGGKTMKLKNKYHEEMADQDCYEDEQLKMEPSEEKRAKVSIATWILDTMTSEVERG